MDILLQNRLDFYDEALSRLPDLALASRISEIAEFSPPALSGQGLLPDLPHSLDLEDALKKPQFGRRSGRTAISIAEVLTRAIRFEELILLATAGLPDHIHQSGACQRLQRLRQLEDDLRYHRIRLHTDSTE